MAGDFDAVIKLLYPTDVATFFTLDEIGVGETFDAVANVEIGPDIFQFANNAILRVGVVNLTRGTGVTVIEQAFPLAQAQQPFQAEHRVNIPAGWANADPGDVLQLVGSYSFTFGANQDTSTSTSVTFSIRR